MSDPMFDPDILDCAERSVLCWLATADRRGQPNVSPKEVFRLLPPASVAIANIASPGSVRNLLHNPKVCVSFVDVFVQKGYKLVGEARLVAPDDPEHERWSAPLRAMAGTRFRIRDVILVAVAQVEPILAPSYRFHPGETTEAGQVAAAMRSYRVRPIEGGG